MGKPVAKKRELLKRQNSHTKVEKKKPQQKKKQLKQKIIQEAGPSNGTRLKKAMTVQLQQKVKNGNKSGKASSSQQPGRFVLAPRKNPPKPTGDSDSEEEEYINRFFDDVEIEDDGDTSESTSGESEPSEESDDEGEDEEVDMDEEPKNGAEVTDSEYSSSSDGEYQFSPSEVVLDRDMMVDEDDLYPFHLEDCDEIDIESYSESPTSSSDDSCCGSEHSGDPEEFVEGNGRFLEVDTSKIRFPNDGPAIVELNDEDNDSDECPQLVPIPESFKLESVKTPPKPAVNTRNTPQPKSNKKQQQSTKDAPLPPTPSQPSPEPAILETYPSQDSSEVLVHMKSPFYIHGLVSLRVIAGAVDLLHHVRKDNSEEILIMATVDDCPVKLSPVRHPCHAVPRGFADSAMKRFHYSHLMAIKQSFAEDHALLLLKRVSERHLRFAQDHMPKKILPDDFRNTAENILRCRFYSAHPQQFTPIPEELLAEPPSSSFPRVLTVGGKNTGKSTFNKCLINSLLGNGTPQVLYVDLDIGQPEFGAPQTISAFLVDSPIVGKGFLKCHRMQAHYSLVYGHLNVALDVVRYAKCVRKFFEHLNQEADLTPIPWVVNTMGYVKGVGLDLIHFIMAQLRPTRVLQFKHPIHHLENFPVRLDSNFMRRHEAAVLNTCASGEWDFEWAAVTAFGGNRSEEARLLKGSEARQMNILCHLGLALNKDFATSLNEVEPICAPLKSLKIRYVGEDSAITECPLKSVNGNLVYLCHEPEGSNPKDQFLEYHGLGLVRAVDEHSGKIYLVTGIDKKLLKRVNCLALTSMPLPLQVITSQTACATGGADPSVVGYISQVGSQSVLFRNVIDRPFRTEAASKR